MRKFYNAIHASLILLLAFFAIPVSAQNAQTGSGLSVSPVLSEFTLRPGEANKLDINLKNITGGDVVAQGIVNDFVSDNVTGTPRILTDISKKSPSSIRDFVSGLENTPIARGEQKKLTVNLQAPQNTPPGAYYGVIRFRAVPAGSADTANPGEVALTASVGTIVLITVPGNLKQQIQLTNLHVYHKGNRGIFFTNQPDQAGIEIKNLGNGFAQPYGTIEIKDMFGNRVHSYQLNNASPRASVLPDSSRIFLNEIKNINKPGRYTMTANVVYGSGNVLVSSKTFWYIPLWLLILALVAISALALITYRLLRRNQVVKRRLSKRR